MIEGQLFIETHFQGIQLEEHHITLDDAYTLEQATK